MIKKRDLIVVWFSCGAASAVAAKIAVETFGKHYNVVVANTPIKEEDSDNTRFLKDVENWIGQEIIIVRNENLPTDSAVDIWERKQYMSGINGAPCTQLLKKEARYQFEKKNKIRWHILGFTYEELNRHRDFITHERHNTLPVLIDRGITKKRCYKVIEDVGILLPISYRQGYPNANCKGCVKATSPTYWNLVRKVDPDVFEERKLQSRRIGAKLVRYKGKRIFLDELPKEATGNRLKSYECGLFCYKD